MRRFNPHHIGLHLWAAATLLGLVSAPLRADDLSSLSDEFDDPATLSQWSDVRTIEQWPNQQLETCEIDGQETGRALLLVPRTSVWYQDYRGVLLFKRVEGDFVVTTDVRVTGRDGRGAPRSDFSLAGLMIRTPRDITPQTWRPGGENYVFLSLGAGREPGRYALEVKTTRNSNSQLELTDGAPHAQLRAVRLGPTLILLRKFDGGPWIVHRRFRRDDMPAALQVGLTCYTDWTGASRYPAEQQNRMTIRDGNPDLRAVIDYIRFARPSVPADWQGQDPADPRQVSDADILAVFGRD